MRRHFGAPFSSFFGMAFSLDIFSIPLQEHVSNYQNVNSALAILCTILREAKGVSSVMQFYLDGYLASSHVHFSTLLLATRPK
jgi:hypothetical protein